MVYSIWNASSTMFVQMMILGLPLTFFFFFLRLGQFSALVTMAIMEECCMTYADMQRLF